MKSKAVIPRETASKDVAEAIDHSLGEGAFKAALDFTDALETGYAHIARQPGSALHAGSSASTSVDHAASGAGA